MRAARAAPVRAATGIHREHREHIHREHILHREHIHTCREHREHIYIPYVYIGNIGNI